MPFSLTLPAFIARYKRTSIVAAIALLLGAVYLIFGGGTSAKATYTAVRGDTPQEVAVSGTVQAQSSADLGFASSGRIKGTYASVGEHVAAGMVLAAIENGDEAAALTKAQASLNTLKIGTRPEELASAKTTVDSDQSALLDAIESAYVTADDAVRNHADAVFNNPLSSPSFKYPNDGDLKAKIEKERSDLSLSLREWQAAVATLTPGQAAAAAEEAQSMLLLVGTLLDNLNRGLSEAQSTAAASYESSIATARTNVTNASAALTSDQKTLAVDTKTLALKQAGSTAEDIAKGQADVADARAALDKTLVVAPFTGIVTKMDAKAGEIVSPSTSEIAMQSDSAYEIEVYIPEVSIAGVAVGDHATTTLDAYGSTVPFAARVIAVDPAETVKDGVPTYKTTLEFLDNDARIRSGMTANVVIVVGVLKGAIVVPAGALGHDATGPYVSLLVKRKVEHRPVTTGSTPALGKVEITAGLTGGETILLTPQ